MATVLTRAAKKERILDKLKAVLTPDLRAAISLEERGGGLVFSFNQNTSGMSVQTQQDLEKLSRLFANFMEGEYHVESTDYGKRAIGQFVTAKVAGDAKEVTISPLEGDDDADPLEALINELARESGTIDLFTKGLTSNILYSDLIRSGAVKSHEDIKKLVSDVLKAIVDGLDLDGEDAASLAPIRRLFTQQVEANGPDLMSLLRRAASLGEVGVEQLIDSLEDDSSLMKLVSFRGGLGESKSEITELRETIRSLREAVGEKEKELVERLKAFDKRLEALEGNDKAFDIEKALGLLTNLPKEIKLQAQMKMESASPEECKKLLQELIQVNKDANSKVVDAITALSETLKNNGVSVGQPGGDQPGDEPGAGTGTATPGHGQTSWVAKVKAGRDININIGDGAAQHTNTTKDKKDKSKEKDKKEAEVKPDPNAGKKVDHAHSIINRQIKADQVAMENQVRVDTEKAFSDAKAKEAGAKTKVQKAQANVNKYSNGMDRGRMGVIGLAVGVITFAALVAVNPVAAAVLGVVSALGAMGGQAVMHGEKRDAAEKNLEKAKEALKKASSARGKAEEAAKLPVQDKEISAKFAERLKTEREVAEKDAKMNGKAVA